MKRGTAAIAALALSTLSARAIAQPTPAPAAPPEVPPPPAAPAPAPPPPPAPPTAAPPPAAPAPGPAAVVPAPPAPAAAPLTAPPPPPPPPPLPLAAGAAPAAPPLGGWHNGFFLRDPHDWMRLYPRLRVHLDFVAQLGPGVSKVPAADGGVGLQPRFFLRRMRPELSGQVFDRWTFTAGFDVGQSVSNANAKLEQSAGKAGEDPTADSARFAPVQAEAASVRAADVYIDVEVTPWLHFMAGQFNAPLGMENRTSNRVIPHMERNLAIRGFVFPSNKEIGLTAWGDVAGGVLAYEVGVFAGDGQNRPQVDARADFIGRVFTRPFLKGKGAFAKAQIGASAKHGDRDQRYVGYDVPAITTGGGAALWSPTYKDSHGRVTHVLPSGSQDAIGGELRVPVGRFELRGEAYYVANRTREAIDGYQLANTERLGAMTGVGWYAQIAAWPFGDAFAYGDPGMVRPRKLDLTKEAEAPKKGLEVVALAAGIHARYDGASREGAHDAKTPGAAGIASAIRAYQLGMAINWWHGSILRLTLDYSAYLTPGSGSADNLAAVPGNQVAETAKSAHVLHEIGTRAGVQF